jgi:hypothetical protein
MPSHVPSHFPSNIAEQPASQVPSKVGAVHVPSQTPWQATARSLVHVPSHEPMQAKEGLFTSHWALQTPLQATTISPVVQWAVTSQSAIALHFPSQAACTDRSAWQ